MTDPTLQAHYPAFFYVIQDPERLALRTEDDPAT